MHNVLAANIRKQWIELKRYLPNTISMIITFYAIFLLLFLGIQVVGAPGAAGESTRYLIVSMVLWFLALVAMQGIGWEITTEATRGTLEQLYMSPVPTWRILFARMVGEVLANLVVLFLVMALAMLTARQWLVFDLATLLPLFLLTILGMIGVGFLVAGLALVYKQIQAFLQIAQFIFMAMVAMPVTLSLWLEALPVLRGATMIRRAMTEGVSLLGFTGFEWLLLGLNSVLWLGLGVVVYRAAERRAMNRGLLGQY